MSSTAAEAARERRAKAPARTARKAALVSADQGSCRIASWRVIVDPAHRQHGRPAGGPSHRSGEPVNPRRCRCGAPLDRDWRWCSNRHPNPSAWPRLYASRTGSRRNLQAMTDNGIRLLATPQQLRRYPEPRPPWAFMLDNGAFGEGGFNAAMFQEALDTIGAAADFVVLPDIVAGGRDSLLLPLSWLERVLRVACSVLLPVQDGMEPSMVRPFVDTQHGNVGLFVGGSTAWKEATMASWGQLAAETACWMHVGRVNTQRRMALAVAAGAHSIDGSSPTRFACTAELFVNSARQTDLFGGPQ